MSAIVRIEELHFSYGVREVLRGVDLEVGPGESVLLLGENGAGKTTLLSCLIGLLRPSRGAIVLGGVRRRFGEPVGGALRGGIAGYVEEPRFFLEKSGRFQLAADAWMAGVQFDEAAIKVISCELGLDPSDLDRRVSSCSTGTRKKIAILRALLRRPELLIVDEPMSGLDPSGVRDLRDALRRIRASQGTTLLVSSHVIAEAQRWATRALVLHGGVISDDVAVTRENAACSRWRMRLDEPISPNDRSWLAAHTSGLQPVDERTWLFVLDDPGSAKRVLAGAIARGVSVVEFAREPDDIEALFFARTSEEPYVED